MSLILDALRKSEAERRRGQSPDLFASPPIAGAPRPRPWPRALSILLFVALTLAAMFVLWPHRRDTVTALRENASGPERPGSATAGASSARDARAPTSADPAPSITSVPSSTRRSAVTPNPAQATASGLARPERPAAPESTATRASSPTPAVALAIPRVGTGPAPMPAGAAPLPALSTAATPTPDADDNSGEALPPIAVLAASERAALPPLKLSMHVWNSESRKRFAIIDGQRVTEGSTVGAGVIEEIRRDGVVLDINGRRVLLPRP